MITIHYQPKNHNLRIKGHAGYDEKGKDIVCAAASMVFHQLCQIVLLYDEGAFYKKPVIKNNSGAAQLKVFPKTEYETWINHDYLYAVTGFRMLMAQYPDRVNLIITEK